MSEQPAAHRPPLILLVDDNTNNLGVLYSYLDAEHFTVLVSQSGERGVELARREKPDLILLDILLPGMSGFETCLRLKEFPETAEIPVIFISALTDVEDKVRGLQAGGVDYITKPFQHEEVLARINTHLTIKRQREELNRLNATKDRFFSIIAHDLRGPFMGLLGALELLRDSGSDMDDEATHELIVNLYETSERTFHLLENLLEWARSQQQSVKTVFRSLAMADLIRETVDLFSSTAEQKGINMSVAVPDDLFAYADRNMINTVVRNLVNNAVKFTPRGGSVAITGTRRTELVEITVADTGVGMDTSEVKELFSLARHKSRAGTDGEQGSGLGLLLAHDYVTRNRGTLTVKSVPGKGSTFTVLVPAGVGEPAIPAPSAGSDLEPTPSDR
jgi:two-component system, sensor histidine kinase and response regulator